MIELAPVVTDADIAVYLDVRNQIEPHDPVSLIDFRSARHHRDRLDLLARRDGVPIAMGFLRRRLEDPDSLLAFGKVGVLPAERRQGVGTRLWSELCRHAMSFGRTGLATEVREDDADSLDYLSKRGFATVFRAQEIALTIDSARVVAAAPPGVSIVSLVAPTLDRAVYAAAVEIEADLPAVDQHVTPPYDEWHARTFEGSVIREASFAAVVEGLVVGVAFLHERPWGAMHGLTGVRRPWRRQGVARALKAAQIQAASAFGMKELRTTNEVANDAIRRLNEALGYTPRVAWLELRGPLLP